jgi:hypothetical protein
MTSDKTRPPLQQEESRKSPPELNTRIHMQAIRPTREQVSFKQHEAYLQDARDELCKHYKLNKSDLIKFLIKKETYILKQPQGTWSYQ